MHLPRTRETTPAGRAEANHGVRGITDIDRPVGNAAAACAYNDATPLIFNDVDHRYVAPDAEPTSPLRSADALRTDPGLSEALAQGASLIEILTPPH
jgi:hypothetical protein